MMDMAGGCFAVPEFIGYGVKEYGTINESTAMMKEIYARGPITCAMDADDDFMNSYSQNAEKNEGVYVTAKKSTSPDHDIEVRGSRLLRRHVDALVLLSVLAVAVHEVVVRIH